MKQFCLIERSILKMYVIWIFLSFYKTLWKAFSFFFISFVFSNCFLFFVPWKTIFPKLRFWVQSKTRVAKRSPAQRLRPRFLTQNIIVLCKVKLYMQKRWVLSFCKKTCCFWFGLGWVRGLWRLVCAWNYFTQAESQHFLLLKAFLFILH